MLKQIWVVGVILALTAPPASIEDVDFWNFSFPHFAGLSSVPFKKGEFCTPPNRDTCVDLVDVVFGDLTGDGQPEAAATLSAVFRGGNGTDSEGFVFQLVNGQVLLIGRFAGGDRAMGTIIRAEIRRQRLVVLREQARSYSARDATETDVFMVKDGKLILVESWIDRKQE
jgi:hypothetical protein